MAEIPVKLVELPEDAFPITLIVAQQGTENVLWSQSVRESGALAIPRLPGPVDVVMVSADGEFSHTGVPIERGSRLRGITEYIKVAVEASSG